jgi:hypothetical protein
MDNWNSAFISIPALVAVMPFVIEFVKRMVNATGIAAQVLSWVLCVGIAMVGYWLEIGMFADLLWWKSLIVGVGVGLATNGIFDTGIVIGILQILKIVK